MIKRVVAVALVDGWVDDEVEKDEEADDWVSIAVGDLSRVAADVTRQSVRNSRSKSGEKEGKGNGDASMHEQRRQVSTYVSDRTINWIVEESITRSREEQKTKAGGGRGTNVVINAW